MVVLFSWTSIYLQIVELFCVILIQLEILELLSLEICDSFELGYLRSFLELVQDIFGMDDVHGQNTQYFHVRISA